jgi:hypothetical protein
MFLSWEKGKLLNREADSGIGDAMQPLDNWKARPPCLTKSVDTPTKIFLGLYMGWTGPDHGITCQE